jgi:YVTN family beta-propeller protein
MNIASTSVASNAAAHAAEIKRLCKLLLRANTTLRRTNFFAPILANMLVAILVMVAWPAQAQSLLTSVPLGSRPKAIAIHPYTNTIYATNDISLLYAIDGSSNTLINNVTDTGKPNAIALNAITNKVYVANEVADLNGRYSVAIFDVSTNPIVTTKIVLGTGAPRALAVDQVLNKTYLLNDDRTVTIIRGNNTTSTVTVAPSGSLVNSLTVNPATGIVYVLISCVTPQTCGAGGNVVRIDGNSDTVISGTLAVGIAPIAIAVNPVTNKIYVANQGRGGSTATNVLTTIDGPTNIVSTRTADPDSTGLAIDPVTNRVYLLSARTQSVTIFDEISGPPVTIALGETPFAIALDPTLSRAYISLNITNQVAVIDTSSGPGAATLTKISSGSDDPGALLVNQITNRVYFAGTNGVGVISDGSTTARTVDLSALDADRVLSLRRKFPLDIAVNVFTNKVYVPTAVGRSVITEIDGVTNAAKSVSGLVQLPYAVAVDSLNDQLYIADFGNATGGLMRWVDKGIPRLGTLVGGNPVGISFNDSNNTIYMFTRDSVNIIDGVTTSDEFGNPEKKLKRSFDLPSRNIVDIVFNSSTSKAYVVGTRGDSITVVDELTATQKEIPVGPSPRAAAVNLATNRIYVSTGGGGTTPASVSVIDGATDTVIATIPVNSSSFGGVRGIAVNRNTNRIYVSNEANGTVSVINGATNAVIGLLNTGIKPSAVVVNVLKNQIYVANRGSNTVSVIDGTNNSFFNVVVGQQPDRIALNPFTGKVYTADYLSSTVSIIGTSTRRSTKLTNNIATLSYGGVIPVLPTNSPTFRFGVASTYGPTTPAVRTVYYQLDSVDKTWTAATAAGGNLFTGALSNVPVGPHLLFAFAVDSLEGGTTSGNTTAGAGPSGGAGSAATPVLGTITAFPFEINDLNNALNIDSSTESGPARYSPSSDGVLLLRYLFGYRGSALVQGALGVNPQRNTPDLIEQYISDNLRLFDIDGDNRTLPLTDGLMILRRMLGLSGSAVTAGAKRGTRTDADVTILIDSLKP